MYFSSDHGDYLPYLVSELGGRGLHRGGLSCVTCRETQMEIIQAVVVQRRSRGFRQGIILVGDAQNTREHRSSDLGIVVLSGLCAFVLVCDMA
jgi:hypothetical protein